MNKAVFKTLIAMRIHVIAIWSVILLGCAGSPPSISNYMTNSNAISGNFTAVRGDVESGTRSYDEAYPDENTELAGFGVYTGKMFHFGAEIMLFGLTPIVGIKNENFGLVSWFNITGIPQGGVAFAQQYNLNDVFSFGAFEYISKNSIPKYTDQEMFRTQDGSLSYNEYGLGMFARFAAKNNFGFSIEPKIGKQMNSERLRYYFGISMLYTFEIVKKAKKLNTQIKRIDN